MHFGSGFFNKLVLLIIKQNYNWGDKVSNNVGFPWEHTLLKDFPPFLEMLSKGFFLISWRILIHSVGARMLDVSKIIKLIIPEIEQKTVSTKNCNVVRTRRFFYSPVTLLLTGRMHSVRTRFSNSLSLSIRLKYGFLAADLWASQHMLTLRDKGKNQVQLLLVLFQCRHYLDQAI